MTPTVFNIAIALLLATYAVWSKNAFSLFLCLFLYVTLHYSYAALPIFSSESREYLIELHQYTQPGVKLVGSVFLLFTAGLLVCRYRQCLVSEMHSAVGRWLGTAILLWAGLVIIHWIIGVMDRVYPSQMTLQNIASAFLMVIFAWGFGSVLQAQPARSVTSQEKICWVLLVMLSLVVSIAAWEVLSLRTWAIFRLESKETMRRASSLLFNPNVLGFWCALAAVFGAYSFHSRSYSRSLSALMLVLAGFGMLLSGSRSGLVICVFVLGLATLLLLATKTVPAIAAFMPLFIFTGGMATIGLFIKGLVNLTGRAHEGLFAMVLLVDRFAVMLVEGVQYAFYKLSDSPSPFRLSETTAISIQGRVDAQLVDNGYLVMLEDAGWLGLVAWIALWLVLVWMGVKALRKAPSINSAYSLSVLLGCAFTAFFIRAFQVFPVWVMISLALAICLAWFFIVLRTSLPPKGNAAGICPK